MCLVISLMMLIAAHRDGTWPRRGVKLMRKEALVSHRDKLGFGEVGLHQTLAALGHGAGGSVGWAPVGMLSPQSCFHSVT